MSFFDNPIANISGGIHDLGKGIANATKNPLVDMAAAAALDYFTGGAGELVGSGGLFDAGLGAAGNAALVTGGIAGLASGNLAQGLMAGMAGYGGASLGEGLGMGNYSTNALNSANTANELSAGYEGTGNPMGGQAPAGSVKVPSNVAEFSNQYANANVGDFNPPTNVYAGNPAITPGGGYNYNLGPDGTPLSQTATQMPTAPASAPASAANTVADTAGKKAVTDEAKKSLFDKFTGLPWYEQAAIGAGGLSLLKAAAQPQKMNMPNSPNTQFIRYSSYSPMGGYTHQGMAPAAATGGLVALAQGGGVHRYDDGGDVAAAAPAYTNQQIADYVTSNNLSGNALTAAEQQYGVSDAQVQAALAAQNPTVAATPAANAAAAAAPAYTTYSNTDLSNYFTNPANAAVLNTPGGLAAAEAQYHADPTAVNAYLQQNAGTLGLSSGDVYGVTQGMGLQGIYNNMDSWVAAHPNATGADITAALQSSGLNQNDVQNYFNRPNSAYGTNVATGKAFTGAGDIYTIGQNQGFSNINNNIDQWIADHPATTTTLAQAQAAMSQYGINETDVERATGKTSAQLYQDLKKQQQPVITTPTSGGTSGAATTTQTVLPTNPQTNAPAGTKNPYGNINNPGDITLNTDGSKTITPNIPGRPYGGFSGMSEVTNAYTAGGGSTGYVNPVYQNMDEFNAANNTLTGGSKAAYDYLMGKTPWNPLPTTPTGEIAVPYQQLMGQQLSPQYQVNTPQIYDPTTHTYKANPNYDPAFSATKDYLGVPQTGLTNPNALKLLGYSTMPNGMMGYPNGDGTFTGTDGKKYNADGTLFGSTTSSASSSSSGDTTSGATGGLMGLAGGGMTVGHLGGYSDGGRLLRGPGDGVSDSIPATIGSTDPEPARLADGEFVVPARIVSELGNGSTEAGARQLYKMMDRIQNARQKTVGKDRVATNTNASKYLPA